MFKHTQTIYTCTQQALFCLSANSRNKEGGGKEVRPTQESSLQGFSVDEIYLPRNRLPGSWSGTQDVLPGPVPRLKSLQQLSVHVTALLRSRSYVSSLQFRVKHNPCTETQRPPSHQLLSLMSPPQKQPGPWCPQDRPGRQLGQAAGTHLQLLYLPSQGGVGSHMLEERGLEADPQVCLLPVAVFLERDNPAAPHASTSAVSCDPPEERARAPGVTNIPAPPSLCLSVSFGALTWHEGF